MSRSIQELADRVGRSVVQVNVTSYAFSPAQEDGSVATISRERATGSGVILSADGYIVTNAHVVENAQKVTVSLRASPARPEQLEHRFPATVRGIDRDTDLAVLKVDQTGLPHLELTSRPVHQGEVVLAFGSPLGLSNSMSMGVVSSPFRQIKESDPVLYIQTDAPINPGNSGGPLVDTRGRVVGINTFILSQSGGSEGLGFAIPARVVRHVYGHLVKEGRVRRGLIGASTQNLNDILVEGLLLGASAGVLVSDIAPDGPADDAGLQVGDVIVAADSVPIRSARQLELFVSRTSEGEKIKLDVQRGKSRLTVEVTVAERPEPMDKLQSLTDPADHLVAPLGILGLALTKEIAALLPPTRIGLGVIVVARAPNLAGPAVELEVGDIIHSINDNPVTSLQDLRDALARVRPGWAAVLQVERDGALRYLGFRME